MIDTGIRRARHAIAVGDGASAADGASGADSSKRRLAVRLWTLLHAQALLRGTIGGVGGAPYVEDDRQRLAARRESTLRS